MNIELTPEEAAELIAALNGELLKVSQWLSRADREKRPGAVAFFEKREKALEDLLKKL